MKGVYTFHLSCKKFLVVAEILIVPLRVASHRRDGQATSFLDICSKITNNGSLPWGLLSINIFATIRECLQHISHGCYRSIV